jgi:toxin YoeB
MWQIVHTKQVLKDAEKLASAGLHSKAETFLEILRNSPYQSPPPFEKLVGDLTRACSRRTNIQHRLGYQPLDDKKNVKIIRMWTHSE